MAFLVAHSAAFANDDTSVALFHWRRTYPVAATAPSAQKAGKPLWRPFRRTHTILTAPNYWLECPSTTNKVCCDGLARWRHFRSHLRPVKRAVTSLRYKCFLFFVLLCYYTRVLLSRAYFPYHFMSVSFLLLSHEPWERPIMSMFIVVFFSDCCLWLSLFSLLRVSVYCSKYFLLFERIYDHATRSS